MSSPSGSPNLRVIIGRERGASVEKPLQNNNINGVINGTDHPSASNNTAELQPHPDSPSNQRPPPPKRPPALSESPVAKGNIATKKFPTDSNLRISSRGYVKPLPKLMPTIRNGAVPYTNDNNSNQLPIHDNLGQSTPSLGPQGESAHGSASVSETTEVIQPIPVANGQRVQLPKQSVKRPAPPPKRSVSTGPKQNIVTSATNYSASRTSGQPAAHSTVATYGSNRTRTVVPPINTQPRKPSRGEVYSSGPSPRKTGTYSSGVKRSPRDAVSPGPSPRQSATTPRSLRNSQDTVSPSPSPRQNTVAGARRNSQSSRDAGSPAPSPRTGVRRTSQSSKDVVSPGPSPRKNTTSGVRLNSRNSKDVVPPVPSPRKTANQTSSASPATRPLAVSPPGQVHRTPSTQSANATSRRPSRDNTTSTPSAPGLRRVPSNQGASLTRRQSRDTQPDLGQRRGPNTVQIPPKTPPSNQNVTPPSPRKIPMTVQSPQNKSASPDELQTPPSPLQKSPNSRPTLVPRLSLVSMKNNGPEINSNPTRVTEPVVPIPQGPQTSREKAKTHFIDDDSGVIPVRNLTHSKTISSPGTVSGIRSMKPTPPTRSVTLSSTSKGGAMLSPRQVAKPESPKLIPLPTKLRKRTYSVSKKKSKKVVLTSVTSNNTQARSTCIAPNGILISNQSYTNSVTLTTIQTNDSFVMDNLSMLLSWSAYYPNLFTLFANGAIVAYDLVENRVLIRLYVPAMRPVLGNNRNTEAAEAKRIQNAVLLGSDTHLLAVVNFVSDLHHTFMCWNVAKLGGKPDIFDLTLTHENKSFYPLHKHCSIDGNMLALCSGETVLVYLYNVGTEPKKLCELSIKGASAFKMWALDVSMDGQTKPIQVAGHVVDSVLLVGDNDGKVSVLDAFGRQLCSSTLPRQSNQESPTSQKLTSPRGSSPRRVKPLVSLQVTCFHLVRGTRMFFAGHEDGTVSLWLLDQDELAVQLSPLKSYQVNGPVQDMCIDYHAAQHAGAHLLISIRKSPGEYPSVLYLELPKFLREIVQNMLK